LNHRCSVLAGVLAVFLLLSAVTLYGSTAGKIAGTVRSAATGEPLAGATVGVVGKSIFTVTDSDGEFYLINLPVATYDLSVQLIGYRPEKRTNVLVLLDLTTPLDIRLAQTTVAIDTFVTVVAERPLIQKDLTGTVETITREELATLPNVRNIGNMLLQMSGTTVSSDGLLHVRGGRGSEVTYYFDGMPIQDQFASRLGTRVSPDALEEISLASGGFTAEYGEALSGVVNLLTQEGGNDYGGKLKIADGFERHYDVNQGDFGNLRRTQDNYAVFNLAGPLPMLQGNKASFFNSVEYAHNGGYLPHNRSVNWTVTSKLSLQPVQQLKLTFSSSYYKQETQQYQHQDVNGRSYDFALANSGLSKGHAFRFGSRATWQLSNATMMTFKAGHFETETKRAPDHLFDVYWDQWPGYSVDAGGKYNGTIQDNYLPDSTYLYTNFISGGKFYPYYLNRRSSYNSAGFDLMSQVNKYHLISLGGEYRKNKLSWDNKQFFNTRPYGEKYDVGPAYASAYVQDKIELGYMIINAGWRVDYLNAKVNYWDDVAKKSKLLSSKSKMHFSPRLGFSHPVSEKTLFHANYGYYYQVPRYPFMFTNLQGDLTTGYPLVGNPDMEPEKTISYEFGVTQQVAENTRLMATTYYKDISNLASSRLVTYGNGSGAYTLYHNGDYGSVKGLDLVLTKRTGSRLSGTANYSYMIAEGNSSDANEFYYNYFTVGDNAPPMPVQKYPLSFDQRHSLSVDIDYRLGRNDHPRLFGYQLPGAWGINALFTYGSGMPFTKTDESGLRIGGLNESRMPATYRVDVRMDKDFYLAKNNFSKLRLFVEINNLFDRRNVTNVYTRTGLPNDDGYDYELSASSRDPITAERLNRLHRLLAQNPQYYDEPIRIQWGFEWMF
jgi:outer membrane receptor protein involved in Fe transport